MLYIYGQEDYVERINNYLQVISPSDQLRLLPFPVVINNPEEFCFDYTTYDIELDKLDRSVHIIVAFAGKYQKEAEQHLRDCGFSNVRLFDAVMDNDLKKPFFKKIFAMEGREFSLIDDEKTVVVYMAKNIIDKEIKNNPAYGFSHIIPIQVGASMTGKRIADLTDNTGDNISERNRHYSETTALYWMWKNAEADYLGLCHYRRLWKDLDKIAEKLQNFVTDVVLPMPSWMEPSVMEGHLKHYTPDVWPMMMEVLRRRTPEYYDAAQKIYDGNILYACNMLIAKRHVLNHLCSWMFPIVMEVEERTGDLSDPYRNRYCGFCTEQLITLYFLYNKQNWRIAHAEKIFLE